MRYAFLCKRSGKINVNKFPLGHFSQINLNSIVKSDYNCDKIFQKGVLVFFFF